MSFKNNEALKFTAGFVGMISLGLAFLVVVGFYEAQVSGPDLSAKVQVESGSR
ncbi:hypothetical protein KGQ31_02210 [Patescibacteria group bacterium]|nr:hypothetical protein [Patescibacteria group bacterium]